MKKTFSILIIFSILTSLTVEAKNDYLVGKAVESSMRDQVCYLSLNNGDAVCSGVRISADYVLTAQHCARDAKGKKNEIQMKCNGNNLKIEKVYESKDYIKFTSSAEVAKTNVVSSYDFAVIKVKTDNSYIPKFKLLKNFSEYRTLFLNGEASAAFAYSENTYCEIHGFGKDKRDELGRLNSASLETTTYYKDRAFLVQITSLDGVMAVLDSPLLPENNKDWVYSTVRPGDSGGPMFCLSKNNEQVLSGIASVLQFGDCPAEFQHSKKTGFFKPSPVQCNKNAWGLPTKESLEKATGVRLED